MNFRGNSEDHQFVGKVLGIYRGRTSSGYFNGFSDGPILGSSDEMFFGIFIGNFRGMEPSENSEEGVPRHTTTSAAATTGREQNGAAAVSLRREKEEKNSEGAA
ncbi:hypothetical protein F2Q69_00021023 [Brassica cretica]|uniref:Uncharacterized protein n=1 Tax=Brassica cretica TaxID=69181 RepID=A0A8S9QCQ8_BRACR|nr:hypothetical protein F2Q69_00021023 [Brassica cretica]